MPAGPLGEMRHALRIFGRLVALRYKARLMYPAAYYAFLATKLIGYVSEYAVLWLLVSRFKTIAGWTLPELLLLHSLNVISYTLAASFVYHVARNIEQYVVTGELDTVLLQPVHPLVWLCGFFYSPTHVSQTILGLGVLFGQRSQLWWDLPVLDSLRLHQTMYRLPEARFADNLRLLDELLELGPLLNKAVRQLSLGQRARANLALCLLHDPELVVLDEPTIGLDVLVKDRIRLFLRRLNQERGTTVFLTSHDMADVEAVCERIVVIDEGRILFDGSLGAIKRQYLHERLVKVTLAQPAVLPAWAGIRPVGVEGTDRPVHTLAFNPEETPVSELLSRIVTALPVADLSLDEPSIEAVVRRLQLGEGSTTPVTTRSV
jgi:ABC-type uncharacterized transport system ATPase subunit